LIDGSLDSAAAIGSDIERRRHVRASQDSVTADKSASIFVTYFIKDSYGVCGGDHDDFGDEASNLPLPLNLLVSKKNHSV
jgi:hypothetical protein